MAAQTYEMTKITITAARPMGPHGERAVRLQRRALGTHARAARIASVRQSEQRIALWRDPRFYDAV